MCLVAIKAMRKIRQRKMIGRDRHYFRWVECKRLSNEVLVSPRPA